jgi:potassium-transporting ATPase potassium-binding subunit
MTFSGWLQIACTLALVLLTARPLGDYLARVMEGRAPGLLRRVLGPIERGLYRLMGVDPEEQQTWLGYTFGVLAFSLVGMAVLYLQLRLQAVLPLNPTHAPGMSPELAFNTAASFTSNTNWQNYSGETQAAHLTQMLGLTVHNFTSAATGIAVAIALVRSLTRQRNAYAADASPGLGNFWVDLVRVTLYLLLPLAFPFALLLCALGIPQTLQGSLSVQALGHAQTLALGPIASQEVIKELGTNGGGFFNANSAHPFENPSPLTNALEIWLILAIPAALTQTFGRYANDRRQGNVLLSAMLAIFLGGVTLTYWSEASSTHTLRAAQAAVAASDTQPGGNMEGKEQRFGIAESSLFAVSTSGTSCGAVNAAMDSLTPLGGLVPLVNIMLGEVIFGGVGSGLYGILIFALIAVFIAGLMVGRTPEYLGKKIEANEMKMAILAVLILAADILCFSAGAVVSPQALKALGNGGPHGFTELIYAFSSATGNNGSAFAGLSADNRLLNLTLGSAMILGRFFPAIPALAIAGSMARKVATPPSAGTFPTTGLLFVGLLIGVILIVGALTFFPALALGPIAEALIQSTGKVF